MIDRVVERLAELSEVDPRRAVTPVGAPETDNEIVWEVPDNVCVVRDDDALDPGFTAPEVGESAMAKSLTDAALTVKVYVAVLVPEVATPVTVSG